MIATLPFLKHFVVLYYNTIQSWYFNLPSTFSNHFVFFLQIITPSKRFLEYGYLQQRPFYHQTWFMVTLAAISVVLIIIVIAALCVKSKTYKYKRKYHCAKDCQTHHYGAPVNQFMLGNVSCCKVVCRSCE